MSHLADNAVVLSYYRDHATMGRSLAVVKARAGDHDPATRRFSIGADGISIGADGISIGDVAIPGPKPAGPDRLGGGAAGRAGFGTGVPG